MKIIDRKGEIDSLHVRVKEREKKLEKSKKERYDK